MTDVNFMQPTGAGHCFLCHMTFEDGHPGMQEHMQEHLNSIEYPHPTQCTDACPLRYRGCDHYWEHVDSKSVQCKFCKTIHSHLS
jgi:hypothetical protein